MSYSVYDVVGKSLYTVQEVTKYRWPEDDSPVFGTIPAGTFVGVVETYLEPNANRENFYWGFKNPDGSMFYTIHKQGLYDLQKLRDQGLLTDAEKNTPEWLTQAKQLLMPVLGAALVWKLGQAYFKSQK